MNNNLALPMRNSIKICWVAATLALLLIFGFRYHGMNAVVMADEWYYSSLTRLSAPADSTIPSYLYNAIYGFTKACGTGFLDCVRLFNTVFFLGSAPFIYFVGRRFLSANLASLVALLAMLGPVNSYTAYFMPESFYFFTFWITSLAAFRFNDRPILARAGVLGICIGGLALIKLHALFLIPSFCAFMLYSHLRGKPLSDLAAWRQAVGCIALALAMAVAVRFGFGYIVAGTKGLSVAGSLYAAQAGNSTGQQTSLLHLLHLCLSNLRGHVMALAILFAVPSAALVAHLFARRSTSAGIAPRSPLAIYSALILLALIGMTVAFTAFVAGSGFETNFRLHMRYYNFALPLLVMFAATHIDHSGNDARRLPTIVAAAVAALILFTVGTWHPFTPSLVDSPEYRGITMRHAGFYILSMLSLMSVAAWAWKRPLGARIFLFGFMPLYTIAASFNIHLELRAGGKSNDFDRAGKFANQYLTDAQRDKLAIVGTDVSGLFRTRFHVDRIGAQQYTVPQNMPLDLKSMTGVEWLLLMGDYPTPDGASIRQKTRGYSLLELRH